jgi:nucleoside 2-deoxyribosyltransferase
MKKIYLAIPYTGMQESSYNQANEATVKLLNQGYNVFSPITHSHPLTLLESYNVPHTWEYWQQIDYQFIDWADEVYVFIPKEGISSVVNSTGVNAEIKYAMDHNKPVNLCIITDGELVVLDSKKVKVVIDTVKDNVPNVSN